MFRQSNLSSKDSVMSRIVNVVQHWFYDVYTETSGDALL